MDVSGMKRKAQLGKGSVSAVEDRLDNLCHRLDAALTTTEVPEPQLTTEDKLGMLVAKIKDLEKKVQGSETSYPDAPVHRFQGTCPSKTTSTFTRSKYFVPRQPRGPWNLSNSGPTPLLQSPSGGIQHPPKHKWTPDRQPICSYCHNAGYMVRDVEPVTRTFPNQQLYNIFYGSSRS